MTFIHRNWTGKRDYETTNVVAAEAAHHPGIAWNRCTRDEFNAIVAKGAQALWMERGVRYFGWL